jgi:putative nucleotidyltransferase with HDIG domain
MWLPEKADALAFLHTHLATPNLRLHSLASGAIMKAIAPTLGGDPHLWELAGLFHDLDLDLVAGNMARHGKVGAGLLEEKGFPPEAVRAILAHNSEHTGVRPESSFEIALLASEQLTGLITAVALVKGRSLALVEPASVKKRMKEARFAAGVNRQKVLDIEKTGLPFDEFLALAVGAMQAIAPDLGL